MSFLKGGKFKPAGAAETTTTTTTTPASKPSPFGKKLGSLNKPTATTVEPEQPKEIDLDKQEELHAEEPVAPTKKPKLGAKKTLGGGLKKKQEEVKEVEEVLAEVQTADEIPVEEVKEEETTLTPEQEAEIAAKEDAMAEAEFCGDVTDNVPTEEVAEETPVVEEEPVKKTTKKASTTKKRTTSKKKTDVTVDSDGLTVTGGMVITNTPAVDETKRVTSLEEIDILMRPVIAPTTPAWEKEKREVLDALNAIKVEQDMTMPQVRTLLAELDNVRFEVLQKQDEAENSYNGLKKEIEAVQAIAISNSGATNNEGRKAAAVLACKNHVTESGAVVDLDMYMLLVQQRHKFYLKVIEMIEFRKYSLVNYNNALRLEANQ